MHVPKSSALTGICPSASSTPRPSIELVHSQSSPMNTEMDRLDAIRILSLDGGDVRCLSQLMILHELIHRAETDAGKSILPCEFFHSMTGVGAGGVLVIFLGVLKMSLETAIATFSRISHTLFSPKSSEIEERSSKLEELIRELLTGQGLSIATKLRDPALPDSSCKVSICYMSAVNFGPCRLLRSYKSRHVDYNPTIVEAIRIAWATPGVFSPVYFGPNFMQEELVSAVNGASNPTFEAIKEANETLGGLCRISCLLSLGAGKPGISSIDTNGLLQQTAHDTETTAGELQMLFAKLGVYFRFSVEHGLESEQDVMISQRLDQCAAACARIGSIHIRDLLCQPGRVLKPDHGLPPLSAFFIPRKEPMDFITKSMLGTDHAKGQRISVISALGGSGKTQLAIKFARDQDETYDHIIFVDASSKANIRIELINRIKSLDPECNPTSINEARQLLARPTGSISRNWLLILDNADDPNVDLSDIFPHCDHGCILITTRNPILGNLAPESHLVLDAMNSKEAVEVLLSIALGAGSHRSNADLRHALTIVQQLGYLPLAIMQAGCYIKMRKSFRTYLELLEHNRARLLRSPAKGQRDSLRYDHSVYAAFDVTLDALSLRSLQILSILSFLHFSHFPWRLIKLAIACSFAGERFDLLERGKDFAGSIHLLRAIFCAPGTQSDEVLDQVLLELQQYSLVTLVTIHNVLTLRFHPLLHAWAQDRLSSDDRQCFRAAAIRLIMCGTCTEHSDIWEFVIPHISRLSAESEELHINDKAALAMVVYDSNRDTKTLLKTWTQINQMVKAVHGEFDIRRTRASLELAAAYWENGQVFAGQWLLRRVVEIRTKTLGKQHSDTLESMVHLARVLRKTGHILDAKSLCTTIVSLREKHPQPQENYKGEELYQLGLCHMASQQFKEAKHVFLGLLPIRKALRGNSHREVTQVMYLLAQCYDRLGNPAGAEALRQEALDVRASAHGVRHNRTLAAMFLLAESYCQQHNFKRAEELFREVIRLRRESPQSLSGEILHALTRLAEVLSVQQRYAEAEPFWREVIIGAIRLRCYEKSLLYSLNSLAEALYHQGQFNESELTWKYVLKRDWAIRIPRSIIYEESLSATCWLAVLLTVQARHSDAEIYWRQAVETQVRKAWNVSRSLHNAIKVSNDPSNFSQNPVSSPIHKVSHLLPTQKKKKKKENRSVTRVAGSRSVASSASNYPIRSRFGFHSSIISTSNSATLSVAGYRSVCSMPSVYPSRDVISSYSMDASHWMPVEKPSPAYNYGAALTPMMPMPVAATPHNIELQDTDPAHDLYHHLISGRDPTPIQQNKQTDMLGTQMKNKVVATDTVTSTELSSGSIVISRPLRWRPRVRFGKIEKWSTMAAMREPVVCCPGILQDVEGPIVDSKGINFSAGSTPIWKDVRGAGRRLAGTTSRSSPELDDPRLGLAKCLSTLGKYAEAENVWHQVTNSCRQSLGPQHYRTLYAASQYATAVERQGNLRDAEVHWTSVAIYYTERPDDNSLLTKRALCHLADLLYNRNAFKEAAERYGQVCKSSQETLDSEQALGWHALHRLAEATFYQHDYEAAEPLLQKVVVHQCKKLGPSDILTLQFSCLLAETFYHRCKFEQSQLIYQDILKRRQYLLEENIVSALQRSSEIMLRRGDHNSAEPLLRSLYEDIGKRRGAANLSTIDALSKLAKTVEELKHDLEAENLYRALLGSRRMYLGNKNTDTLATICALSTLMLRREQFADAEPLIRELHVTNQQMFGDLDPRTLVSLSLLSDVLYALENYTEAEPLSLNLLGFRQKTLGSVHKDTLHTLHRLLTIYLSQKEYAAAEPLLRHLHESRRRTLGDESPITSESLALLANALYQMGRDIEAEPLYSRLLELRKMSRGDEHEDTLRALSRLADIALRQKQYHKAKPVLFELYEIREKVLDTLHSDTQAALLLLADTLDILGQNAEATILYQRLLETRQRSLGDEHEATIYALYKLVMSMLGKDMYAAAEPLLRRLYYLYQSKLGGSNPATLEVLSALADVTCQLGREAEASSLYEELSRLGQGALGNEHTDTEEVAAMTAEIIESKQKRSAGTVQMVPLQSSIPNGLSTIPE